MEGNNSFTDLCESSMNYKLMEQTNFGEMTKIHYQMFEETSNDSCENVIHLVNKLILALDIFDDVQDQDNDTAPWAADSRQAINLGLHFLVSSYAEIKKCNFVDTDVALHYINTNLLNSIKGQYLDIENRISTEEDYIEVCKMKSGSLVSMAAVLGALSASASQDSIATIHQYSLYVGIAAQISNDIRDLIDLENKSDFAEKKMTLPIIHLLNSNRSSGSLVEEYFKGRKDFKEVLPYKTEMITQFYTSGSLSYATNIKNEFKKKATELMYKLPVKEAKKEILYNEMIKTI